MKPETLTPEPRGYIVVDGLLLDDPMQLHVSHNGQQVVYSNMVVWKPQVSVEQIIALRDTDKETLSKTPFGRKVASFLPKIQEVEKYIDDNPAIKGIQGVEWLRTTIQNGIKKIGIPVQSKLNGFTLYLESGQTVDLYPALWRDNKNLYAFGRRIAETQLKLLQSGIQTGSGDFLFFTDDGFFSIGFPSPAAQRIRKEIRSILASNDLPETQIERIARVLWDSEIPVSDTMPQFTIACQIVKNKPHWLSL